LDTGGTPALTEQLVSNKETLMKLAFRLLLVPILVLSTVIGTAHADEITDWNKNMLEAARTAATAPIPMTRIAALVQAAVFDAVNGIERKYTPIHVQPNAPASASRSAAAIQAAYATLVNLYPAQKAALDTKLAASLAAVTGEPASINQGIAWGQTVADAILAWRNTDGFAPAPPQFLGGDGVGQWRPTPPGLLPGATPQFGYMTPWIINSQSQFRPAGPPALNSDRYLAEFNETKLMGRVDSASRSADQTTFSLFWNASTASYYWDQAAVSQAEARKLTPMENARLLAAVNLAMADAAIGCWEAKYTYLFWRPVTAIPLAETDGNGGTTEDPGWTPLFATPAHPEYPSGHSCVSGAAGRVLSAFFGDNTAFTLGSDVMTDVTRFFPSFTAALEEVKNARIFAGIHFRAACDDGQSLGIAVADHVLGNALLPLISLTFDTPNVATGRSFGATFSGGNFTATTYFDVRFRGPDGVELVAVNWQQGTSLRHTVPGGTALGDWVITGVRAHQDANDHTGGFVPVSTTVRVISIPF
jgi:hypothetical protein